MSRYTITLNNVKYNKLVGYVEELCRTEKVKIKTCYEDSYSWLHDDSDTNWFNERVKNGQDYVLESNSLDRLNFVQYLYDNKVKANKFIRSQIDSVDIHQDKQIDSDTSNFEHGVLKTNAPAQIGTATYDCGIWRAERHSIDSYTIGPISFNIKVPDYNGEYRCIYSYLYDKLNIVHKISIAIIILFGIFYVVLTIK